MTEVTETVGNIYKIKDNQAIIVASVDPYMIERHKITRCMVRYDDGRHITAEQRKKAYAIISDIAEFTGNVPEWEKELQKYFYIGRYGGEYFSLSSCTVSVARDFISFLIDFCFENSIGTRDTLLNNTDDINRYLYSCLANRKCAVCNSKAEIHHCEGSRVGMGFNRRKLRAPIQGGSEASLEWEEEKQRSGRRFAKNEQMKRNGVCFDSNVGRYAIALCRKCHNKAHNDEKGFFEKNHIYGIKLDEYLVKKLGL